MPNANKIEIAKGVLVDPSQNTVTLKGADQDTVLWYTQEPGSGGNKYVQYWIAFDADPFSENVIATSPKTGKTAIRTARGTVPVAGTYTIYTADPTFFIKRKTRTLTAGGGGIIIDN
jgi:hypothetical protein